MSWWLLCMSTVASAYDLPPQDCALWRWPGCLARRVETQKCIPTAGLRCSAIFQGCSAFPGTSPSSQLEEPLILGGSVQPLFLKESNSHKEQLRLSASAALGEALLSSFSIFIGMLGAGGHPCEKAGTQPAVRRGTTDTQWACRLLLIHWQVGARDICVLWLRTESGLTILIPSFSSNTKVGKWLSPFEHQSPHQQRGSNDL